MLRAVLATALVLLVLVALMFAVDSFSYYNPLNFVPACQYANTLRDPREQIQALSVAAAVWLGLFFLESGALILLIFMVRHIHESFSIVEELFILTVAWMVGNTVGLVLGVFWSSFEAGVLVFDLAVVVMFSTVFYLSVMKPVHATKSDLTIPFAEPSDILNDFPDVLYRPTPARYFFRYLERRFPERLPYFELLNELVHFDHLVADEHFAAARAHAAEIVARFFSQESEHYCDFD